LRNFTFCFTSALVKRFPDDREEFSWARVNTLFVGGNSQTRSSAAGQRIVIRVLITSDNDLSDKIVYIIQIYVQ